MGHAWILIRSFACRWMTRPGLRIDTMTPAEGELNPPPCHFAHRAAVLVIAIMVTGVAIGCSSVIPSKYTSQAERGATFSSIKARPDAYIGKVVILGGVMVEEKEAGEQIWLRLKNRPVDADY